MHIVLVYIVLKIFYIKLEHICQVLVKFPLGEPKSRFAWSRF